MSPIQEKEVRFLIHPNSVDTKRSISSIEIVDIYIIQEEFSLRIRKHEQDVIEKISLTFKLFRDENAIEYNFPMEFVLASQLINEPEIHLLPRIKKIRYIFNSINGLSWQVDMYQDNLSFLTIAELEYSNPIRPQLINEIPDWYSGRNWGCNEMDITNDRIFLSRILEASSDEIGDFKQEVDQRLSLISK